MSYFTLLSASKAQERKLDATSNNLANANTTGYKKDQVVFQEYLQHVMGQDLESEEEEFVHKEFHSPFDQNTRSYVITDAISPNMSLGDLTTTGNDLDFAIESKAFFSVATPQGVRYTRNGKFHLNSDKYLVDLQGNNVIGEKGPIKVEGNKIKMGIDGTVTVDGKEIDKLKLVEFEEPSSLQKMGNSYWATSSPQQKAMTAESPLLRQGMLESSNVDIVKEMLNLITTNRSHAAIHKAIQNIEQVDEKSLSMAKI